MIERIWSKASLTLGIWYELWNLSFTAKLLSLPITCLRAGVQLALRSQEEHCTLRESITRFRLSALVSICRKTVVREVLARKIYACRMLATLLLHIKETKQQVLHKTKNPTSLSSKQRRSSHLSSLENLGHVEIIQHSDVWKHHPDHAFINATIPTDS